uniref:Uncharacterized protein n=1 Tax=Manihot esculenta TaxID=3983 RepID=A0A2C9VZH8_MANES
MLFSSGNKGSEVLSEERGGSIQFSIILSLCYICIKRKL